MYIYPLAAMVTLCYMEERRLVTMKGFRVTDFVNFTSFRNIKTSRLDCFFSFGLFCNINYTIKTIKAVQNCLETQRASSMFFTYSWECVWECVS